jgi:hypothetical protein
MKTETEIKFMLLHPRILGFPEVGKRKETLSFIGFGGNSTLQIT